MNYTLPRADSRVARRTDPPDDVAARFGAGSAPRTASRLPCRWILEGGLRTFRSEPAYAGRSTAALKILLAVALAAEDGDADGDGPIAALLSYAQIGAI